ncbi:MAG: hypothetical protein CHACPFDD_02884 [Phycisphaerae bacterium]|nr:hypothetical protein [Phycisphaerae bacterium]
MADKRKAILLRIPRDVWEGLATWARDELRSVNAQIEFALREALRRRGVRIAPEVPDDQAAPRRSAADARDGDAGVGT